MTKTNETLIKQLNSAKFDYAVETGKNPRFCFVLWSGKAVKVSRANRAEGVIVSYNYGTDLYDLTYYVGTDTVEEITGIAWDQLQEFVVERLAKGIRKAR